MEKNGINGISVEWEKSLGGRVIGVDEAGRGPLVGGVFAGAVSVATDVAEELLHGAWSGINDSKKLSERKRDALAEIIKATPGCVWAVASASAEEIDGINILNATHLAMRRAVAEVRSKLGAEGEAATALVDGLPVKSLPGSRNLVKGDAKSLLIAAASILAKTSRDADCLRLEALYPGYGIAKHKGYPTAAHVEAIRRLGLTPEHRRSFAPCRSLAEPELFPESEKVP